MTNRNPLPLPRFIFMIAPSDMASNQRAHIAALASRIAERDRSLTFEDLEEPLLSATHELFFGGFETPLPLESNLPYSNMPFEIWLSRLRTELEAACGASILARLAVDRIMSSAFTTIDRYLFRDARGIPDVKPFASQFGKENILCCHFHSNRMLIPEGVRNVMFPSFDLEANMAILEREFGMRRRIDDMDDLSRGV